MEENETLTSAKGNKQFSLESISLIKGETFARVFPPSV